MMKRGILGRVFAGVLAILMTFLPSVSAFGLSESQLDAFAENNILFYDPGETISCFVGDGAASVSGETADEMMWTGLISVGFTEIQAAALLGNIASEGVGNPVKHEYETYRLFWTSGPTTATTYAGRDIARTYTSTDYVDGHFDLGGNTKVSYGLGLVQWSFGRRAALYKSVQEKAPDLVQYFNDPGKYNSLSADALIQEVGVEVARRLYGIEIEYIKQEIDSSYSGFDDQTNLSDATHWVLDVYERPGGDRSKGGTHHTNRLAKAQAYYDKFINYEYGGACSSASTFAEFVVAYAWPEYHKGKYLDRMPAYAEIVAERQSEGNYVGGSVEGVAGIDCGGFVTTLVQESGWDAGYNPQKSNTGPQEDYVKANWTALNGSGEVIDTSTLQPGDVAFTTGHTFIYVGEIEGFDSTIASASYDSTSPYGWARAPMAGREGLEKNNDGEIVRWYRKK